MIHLNGMQKSALLLIYLDIQQSASVLKFFNNSEISELVDVMISLDSEIMKYTNMVICEFCNLLKKNKVSNVDIKTRISQIIENTIDTEKSHKLLKKSFIKNDFLHNIIMLEKLGAKNIFFLIQNENLNIISALLIYVNQTLSMKILELFNKKKRLNILKKMVTFKNLRCSGFIELNKIISYFLYIQQASFLEEKRINQIVNMLSYFKYDNIIQFISQIKTPYINILNKVISKYFTFEDIIIVDDISIKCIINNIDLDSLCIVLRDVHNSLKNKFISNMSNEQRKYFKETIFLNKSITDDIIFLKKNLLLQKIKKLIRMNKIIIKQN
ncbi:Flagellar motor switch protein FliG [Buchnera aphidicola (Cinara cuneomaculata)]|uniref:Flagellar motor switch protein FliG n=1 Tax=Buchnera aphidicola (Cinara cuneomaculata) TaxID=1660040 RepID=A0A451CXY2_9GAMM|nr:FliG C-terminal domain-containing protein [Buchnera aphidicola]VFP78028.1 Flagellar motor switch protein FliG [Buchnera aphidicola (Cinara cuneomaculata)]